MDDTATTAAPHAHVLIVEDEPRLAAVLGSICMRPAIRIIGWPMVRRRLPRFARSRRIWSCWT